MGTGAEGSDGDPHKKGMVNIGLRILQKGSVAIPTLKRVLRGIMKSRLGDTL